MEHVTGIRNLRIAVDRSSAIGVSFEGESYNPVTTKEMRNYDKATQNEKQNETW